MASPPPQCFSRRPLWVWPGVGRPSGLRVWPSARSRPGRGDSLRHPSRGRGSRAHHNRKCGQESAPEGTPDTPRTRLDVNTQKGCNEAHFYPVTWRS